MSRLNLYADEPRELVMRYMCTLALSLSLPPLVMWHLANGLDYSLRRLQETLEDNSKVETLSEEGVWFYFPIHGAPLRIISEA